MTKLDNNLPAAQLLDDSMLDAISGGSGPLRDKDGNVLFQCQDCGAIVTDKAILANVSAACPQCGSKNVRTYYGPNTSRSSFHALGR